MRVGMDG
jgi:predicted aspartyl protease